MACIRKLEAGLEAEELLALPPATQRTSLWRSGYGASPPGRWHSQLPLTSTQGNEHSLGRTTGPRTLLSGHDELLGAVQNRNVTKLKHVEAREKENLPVGREHFVTHSYWFDGSWTPA